MSNRMNISDTLLCLNKSLCRLAFLEEKIFIRFGLSVRRSTFLGPTQLDIVRCQEQTLFHGVIGRSPLGAAGRARSHLTIPDTDYGKLQNRYHRAQIT